MTAYYIFRVWFLTFSGDRPRDPALPAAHEAPWTMTVPVIVLSALAIVAGALVFVPQFGGLFTAGVGFPATPGVPPAYTTTDLLLSAEFRRLHTFPVYDSASVTNQVNLAVGVLF